MLPVLGTCYYNGFFFPGAITARVDAVPVYDSTNRYVKWRKHNLTVECILYPGVDVLSTTDPLTGHAYIPKFPTTPDPDDIETADVGFTELRRLLTEPGGLLLFTFKGYGYDVSIGGSKSRSAGIHRDLDFGPKPTLLAWEPVAGPKGIRIVWQCSFAIAECMAGNLAGHTREFSYNVVWAIDELGATVRTISGSLEVVVHQNDIQITSIAEQWRERLAFSIPTRFKRETQSFQLSSDRSRLDFQITDREVISDNAFSEGCTDMQVTESVQPARTNVASQVWLLTIEGTITVGLNKPRWLAWLAFLQIIKSRRAHAQQFARANNSKENKSASSTSTRGGYIRTVDLRISEELYGRSMSFAVTYELFANLGTLIQACGFWAPTPGASWEFWNSNMLSIWGTRGAANLRSLNSDYIISVCDTRTIPLLSESSQRSTYAPSYALFSTESPTAEDSWVYFKPMARVIKETFTTTQYPLGAKTTLSDKGYDIGTTGTGHDEATSQTKPPVIQDRGEYRYKVMFSGVAERIGYEIFQPTLLMYGGAIATPIDDMHFEQSINDRNIDGCIVFRARWRQLYSLDKKPDGSTMSLSPDPRTLIK